MVQCLVQWTHTQRSWIRVQLIPLEFSNLIIAYCLVMEMSYVTRDLCPEMRTL